MDSKSVTGLLIFGVVLISVGLGGGFLASTVGVNPLEQDTQNTQMSSNNNSTTDFNQPEDVRHSNVIDSRMNGVVTVYTQKSGFLSSQGSGFVFRDGYVMTNEHVVDGNATKFYVRYRRGEWSEAELVGTDTDTDIAVLQPSRMPDYVRVLNFSSEPPRIGQEVGALGSPSGLDNTVTTGVVSSTERAVRIETRFSIPDTIQTDAALNPGNSGGPLIDLDTGKVVGVNRAKQDAENIGFAVPSSLAKRVGNSIIATGNHSHPYVGIATRNLNPTSPLYDNISVKQGVIVVATVEGSPGEVFETGTGNSTPDVITAIDGIEVDDTEDISGYLLRKKSPGSKVTFTVYRDGKLVNVTTTLISRKEGSELR